MTTAARIAPLALLVFTAFTAFTACRAEVEILGDGSHGAGNGGGNGTSGDPNQPSDPACDPTWMQIVSLDGAPAKLNGVCMDRPAQIAPSGDADCFIIDLRLPEDGCDCDAEKGMKPLDPSHAWAIDEANKKLASNKGGWTCFCEVPQISGDPDEVTICQNTPEELFGSHSQSLNGFCFVDPSLTPPRGSPQIVANCTPDTQHLIRVVGAPSTLTEPGHRSLLFVCQTDACKSP